MDTEPHVLGIDDGTESCRVAICGLEGRPLAFASTSDPTAHLHSGWAEQSPEDWWNALQASPRTAPAIAEWSPSTATRLTENEPETSTRAAGMDVHRVVACGGAPTSRDWVPMPADVCGVPVALTEVGVVQPGPARQEDDAFHVDRDAEQFQTLQPTIRGVVDHGNHR